MDARDRGTYTTEGIIMIADALKVDASLTSLVVEYNGLGDEGKQASCETR